MKKVFIGLTALISIPLYASTPSLELGGTYSNAQGCVAEVSNCVYYTHPESGQLKDQCTLSVYKEVERVDEDGSVYYTRKTLGSISKNGTVSHVNGNEMTIEDNGFRFSSLSLTPGYSKVTGYISVNNTFEYPGSYAENSVSNFDIEIVKGFFGKTVASCDNLQLEEEY